MIFEKIDSLIGKFPEIYDRGIEKPFRLVTGDRRFEFETLGELEIKGKIQKVKAWIIKKPKQGRQY